MTSRFFQCLIVLVAVLAFTVRAGAQTISAGPTHPVELAVEEAKRAGVTDETLSRLLSLGYDSNVNAASMSNLVRIIGEVKKEKLPQEPFVDKIQEGLAKHVTAESIERVLNQKKQDYLFSLSIMEDYLKKHGLKEEVTPKDLIGIAETLQSGLTRQDLIHTVEDAPAVSLARLRRAITLLASLTQFGFDRKLSDQIVVVGLQHGFFTSQNRGFASAIIAGKRRAIPDETISEAALSIIKSGGTVDGFCSKIGISCADIMPYTP